MDTNTHDIAKMAAALADAPEVENAVCKEIGRSTLVSMLLSMRVAKGRTQEEIAKAMGCDSSKVSRIESGNDSALRLGDIIAYVGALGQSITLSFDDPTIPAANRIKDHVFRIAKDLKELAALAGDVGENDKIAQKIHQFYGEVLFNFLVQYRDGYEQLNTSIKLKPKSHVMISSELDDVDSCSKQGAGASACCGV